MYGLNLNVATMQPALRYQAIQSGDIQITDAYSTDAELERYDLQVLEDDKQLFPPYQGAPLMKEALLKKHPESAARVLSSQQRERVFLRATGTWIKQATKLLKKILS